MENPIMIEWKYYQCTWTVVDNVDVIEYVPFIDYFLWIISGNVIWFLLIITIILVPWRWDK